MDFGQGDVLPGKSPLGDNKLSFGGHDHYVKWEHSALNPALLLPPWRHNESDDEMEGLPEVNGFNDTREVLLPHTSALPSRSSSSPFTPPNTSLPQLVERRPQNPYSAPAWLPGPPSSPARCCLRFLTLSSSFSPPLPSLSSLSPLSLFLSLFLGSLLSSLALQVFEATPFSGTNQKDWRQINLVSPHH
eukprot:2807747-Rhodomonas_salina.2